MNKIETLIKKPLGCEFDTPKKLNRSIKQVPAQVIADLEAGSFTCEMIDNLALSYPIFRYMTCITVHGLWPEISRSYIGHYKNVIQNANGSVEIRYSAIDREKIKTIRELLSKVQTGFNGFYFLENSSYRLFRKSSTLTKENFESLKIEYTAILERVQTAKIYGSCHLYRSLTQWGTYEIILDICPLAIPETEVRQLVYLMTGMSETEFEAKAKIIEAETEAKRIEDAKNRAIADIKYKAAQAEREAKLQKDIEPLMQQIKNLPECNNPAKGILVKVCHFDKIPESRYNMDYSTSQKIEPFKDNVLFYFVRIDGKGSFGKIKRSFALSLTFDMDNLQWIEKKQVKESECKYVGYYLARGIEPEKPKVKPQSKQPAKAVSNIQTEVPGISILRYSDKAIAVFGNTYPVKDKLSSLGGSFNKWLTNPETGQKQAGWIFPASKAEQLQRI